MPKKDAPPAHQRYLERYQSLAVSFTRNGTRADPGNDEKQNQQLGRQHPFEHGSARVHGERLDHVEVVVGRLAQVHQRQDGGEQTQEERGDQDRFRGSAPLSELPVQNRVDVLKG